MEDYFFCVHLQCDIKQIEEVLNTFNEIKYLAPELWFSNLLICLVSQPFPRGRGVFFNNILKNKECDTQLKSLKTEAVVSF